jgi:hypothetical protein
VRTTHREKAAVNLRKAAADKRTVKSYLSAGVVLFLGWFAFVRDERPPILGHVSFGVHEFGHLLFSWSPKFTYVLMGNGTETLLPLAAGAAFVWYQRDWVAGGLCLAWSATTMQDAAVYIGDAPYQALPLFPEGAQHDWAYLLGPEQLDRLAWADELSTVVRGTGIACLVAAVVVCLLPLVYSYQTRAAKIT